MASLFAGKDDNTADLKGVTKAIEALSAALPTDTQTFPEMTGPARKKLQATLMDLQDKLQTFDQRLDLVAHPSVVFDPSHPKTIANLIVQHLLEQPRQALGGLRLSYGSGVYAIYYKGDFACYKPITRTNWPIYVGKADPELADAHSPREQGRTLSARLAEHAKTIGNASNLDLADFECRFLVTSSAWQGMAEHYLIRRFKPVWNKEIKVCQGFGKHGDAATTRANLRSKWDELHPGRKWATKGNKPNKSTAKDIAAAIAQHYRDNPVAV
jgi:hypothetical protein